MRVEDGTASSTHSRHSDNVSTSLFDLYIARRINTLYVKVVFRSQKSSQ